MSKLSNAILDIYECAQTAFPDQFSEYSLSIAKSLLGFESASVVRFNAVPGQALSIKTIYLHNTPVEKLDDRPKIAGSELLTHSNGMRSNDPILVRTFQNQGSCIAVDTSNLFDKRHDAEHIAYCKKYENAHTLALMNRKKNNDIDLVALWRAQPKNRYSAKDIHVGNQILPHLLQANAINRQIVAGFTTEGRGQNASLIASAAGILYFCEMSAISLMQSEWKEWNPPLLPSIMIAAFKSNNSMRFKGRNIIASALLQNGMLCIKLSRASNFPELTVAEERVAQMASQGLSHKEIAKILGNSPSTIRNQLHSVYQKLNVANKTSLAQTLSLLSRQ